MTTEVLVGPAVSRPVTVQEMNARSTSACHLCSGDAGHVPPLHYCKPIVGGNMEVPNGAPETDLQCKSTVHVDDHVAVKSQLSFAPRLFLRINK
jgi:hypothetical protein